jgi:hypothetical protein
MVPPAQVVVEERTAPGPPREPEAVRVRLRDLAARGYYHAPITGQPDDALADALRRCDADTGGASPSSERQPVAGRADGGVPDSGSYDQKISG